MLIYVAIGAFGFLFLVAMLFFGGDAGGNGADDHGVAHGEGEAGGPSVFSARVMAAFLTAFGVGGVVGRYYDLSHPAASGVGVIAGMVMAGMVYQFAKLLYSQQASSELRMATLIGRSAEVTVAIPAGGLGQVTVSVGGERSEHIARGAGNQAVARGTEVVVTGLRGDSLVVAPASSEARGGAQ